MKVINKIAVATAGLALMSSSVFAQSLADAKKAIDAEQYQKAKSMLKNLTVTESSKDENFFYLGWVYVLQDYTDSAKAVFSKGISVNPKSALNYAGLAVVAHMDKDAGGESSNSAQAISNAGKNDKPYVYLGKGYLLKNPVSPADANAAIAVLQKGQAINGKDPELLITLGNAYRSQLKSNDAYGAYSAALALDPKSPLANVAQGVLMSYANNFEVAVQQYQAALAVDPNFGPAYREWAETTLREAHNDPKNAQAKMTEAAGYYTKYINLTDNSLESQMRYADFLISAQDYKTLQTVAGNLSKSSGANLRVYRYLMVADYENKDYTGGIAAANTWMTKADPKRILPIDYVYLGRLEIATGKDSIGLNDMKKAFSMDTTQVDMLADIAKAYYGMKKYQEAGDAYRVFTKKGRGVTLNDYFREGSAYYFAYDPKNPKADSLLTQADSAFSYIVAKTQPNPFAQALLYRARINDLKEPDHNNIKGLAKPFYEQYVAAVSAKGMPTDASGKKSLIEAYLYLGRYYQFIAKDPAKASENYAKAKEVDPTNPDVVSALKSAGK